MFWRPFFNILVLIIPDSFEEIPIFPNYLSVLKRTDVKQGVANQLIVDIQMVNYKVNVEGQAENKGSHSRRRSHIKVCDLKN